MGMFGTKAGMTQIFTPEGLALPATVIALEEGNIVTQVHTVDKSGYNAVQIGYQVCAERKVTRPEAGHCKKAGASAMRHLREFKVCLQLSGFKAPYCCTVPILCFTFAAPGFPFSRSASMTTNLWLIQIVQVICTKSMP